MAVEEVSHLPHFYSWMVKRRFLEAADCKKVLAKFPEQCLMHCQVEGQEGLG